MSTARDRLNKVGRVVHTGLYRMSGGRIGGRVGKMPVLLLTTTGRKSGRPRTVPVMYMPDGERMVVIASNAGQDHHPAWFLNLQANPMAEATTAGQTRTVRASVAPEAEKAELWPRVAALYKGYDAYRRRTSRDIPLLILEPIHT